MFRLRFVAVFKYTNKPEKCQEYSPVFLLPSICYNTDTAKLHPI